MALCYFTLNAACAELEVAAGTTLAVDPDQRTLIRGETYAFVDPDGDHFLARITSVAETRRAVIDRDSCEVVGRVVRWRPVLH